MIKLRVGQVWDLGSGAGWRVMEVRESGFFGGWTSLGPVKPGGLLIGWCSSTADASWRLVEDAPEGTR